MTTKKLRLAFAGTPELAKIVLESLIKKNQHVIKIIFTQPDRPAGRGRKLKQSEVKQYALANDLPLLQPSTIDEVDLNILNDCDLMLVVAYGLLITPAILAKPKYGCINIHPSLLPRWRGAAPIQRAIEAGDQTSGISMMQMDQGLDTGPILTQIRCPIEADETAGDLHDKLAKISADNINATLSKIANQQLCATQQDQSRQSYAHKITKQEAQLDWTKPAVLLAQKIRAFNPHPIAHTVLNGVPMRVWAATANNDPSQLAPGSILPNHCALEVSTVHGILRITKLQLPGKQVITAQDFLNSHQSFFNEPIV